MFLKRFFLARADVDDGADEFLMMENLVFFLQKYMIYLALLLPLSPLAPYLGFAPLPPLFFALLLVLVGAYLLMVEGGKRWFYRQLTRA
jgi:hypothetical protein